MDEFLSSGSRAITRAAVSYRMNSSILASQVTWPLQTAISATFLATLIGLAGLLRRPGARALSIGLAWTVLALLLATIGALVGMPFAGRTNALLQACIAGSVAASAPPFMVAVDILASTGSPAVGRPLVWRSMRSWTAACLFVLLIGQFDGGSPESGTSMALFAARAVLMAAYIAAAAFALHRRRSAPRAFRLVLLIFGLAFLLQALRPITAVMLFAQATEDPLADPRALAFVVVNIFMSTVLGLACMLVALAEEREAVATASRQLRDSAVAMERAQRLESVGRLASGVAHDFNNFLAIIKSGVDLARLRFSEGELPAEELEAVDQAADRGAALTRQLLTFARKQPQAAFDFDVVQQVRSLTGLLDRMVGRQIGITYALPEHSMVVHMDPTQLEQVLVNLVSNARHAIVGNSGHITIALSPTLVNASAAAREGELAPGSYAVLTVTDTGAGIPPDVLANIFEPFFTTRPDDGGTGLGLSTVQGIVRQAGGEVRVTSTPGAGTTFTVLLPIRS